MSTNDLTKTNTPRQEVGCMKRGHSRRAESLKAKVGGTAGAAVRASRIRVGGWDDLTPGTRRLFQTRGLGRGLGTRTSTMARRIYGNCVPPIIRYMGEDAVRNYLKENHFSHKRSVANAPQRAKAPSNIVLENVRKNLARGRRNMTAAEVEAAKSAGLAWAIKRLADQSLKSPAKTGAAVGGTLLAGYAIYRIIKAAKKSRRSMLGRITRGRRLSRLRLGARSSR